MTAAILKNPDGSVHRENGKFRMAVLRDGNGVVHFIPNGQINCVSNETHGWSRATFEIGVAYKENVDHVMSVLADLTRKLRADPKLGPMILEEATDRIKNRFDELGIELPFPHRTVYHCYEGAAAAREPNTDMRRCA